MSVYIFRKSSAYSIPPQTILKNFAGYIFDQESHSHGNVCVIFTGDKEIRKLNTQFLNRDYPTDVLTFPYSDSETIDGDVYISLDTVYSNSKEYRTEFVRELVRVFVHGLLHLMGYIDHSAPEKQKMQHLEDQYLDYFFSNYNISG